jgi:hypothetical protein
VTHLESVEAASDITRSHFDKLCQDAEIRFETFAIAYFPKTFDQELRLRLLESYDSGVWSEGPERSSVAGEVMRVLSATYLTETYRSLQIQMMGRRRGLAGVLAGHSA